MSESVENEECEIFDKTNVTNSQGIKDLAIRKQNAKNRWKLLARAILSDSRREFCEDSVAKKLTMSPINVVSSNMSQAFSGFELVKIEQLTKDDKTNYKIKLDVDANRYECNVHIEKMWSVKDLIGFNNTGNLSLWASEAALSHYAMENLSIFENAWVLELGGGMFCLASLMVAKYSNAFAVHLSDGNEIAVTNVKKSIILNDFKNCFMKCTGSHFSSYFSLFSFIFPSSLFSPLSLTNHSLAVSSMFYLFTSSQMGKLNEAVSIRETKIQFHPLCGLLIFSRFTCCSCREHMLFPLVQRHRLSHSAKTWKIDERVH
jgi:hypothetical protein